MVEDWEIYRQKIIGLGEQSSRKSYYPELQDKIDELEANQTNLQAIINGISDGIIIYDKKGRILSVNKQAQKVLNIKEEEVLRFTIQDFFHDQQSKKGLVTDWNEIPGRKPKIMEWIIVPFQTHENILVQISINRTSWNGKPALVGVFRDFSERKRYEEELVVARKKAEENDRLKTAFLANLSHEIRTPMNAIIGFSDLLKKTDISSDVRDRYIDIVHRSGHHLLAIIDDIIEISRIETGQVSPNFAITNVKACMQDLYNALQVSIPLNKNLKLELQDKTETHVLQILTDKTKLRQVLSNLVDNAIKYSEKGKIIMSYRFVNQGKELEFSVQDTGIGIEEKYHKIIFDRFSRVEGDMSIIVGGSGIGLAISKAYVEMMGGTIKVDSRLGQGSVFSFTLPANIPVEMNLSLDTTTKTTYKTLDHKVLILVAEDDDYNFLYFSKLLPAKNFGLLRAVDGKEAVDMVLKNENISLVLMDIKMPMMNGYEALSHIREIRPALPIIAQTAYALPDDNKKIKQAGFNGYLTKPIRKNELYNMINQVLSQ